MISMASAFQVFDVGADAEHACDLTWKQKIEE